MTRPPGTYTPARPTATYRSVTVAPAPTLVTTSPGSWARQTSRSRRMVSSSAARRFGSSASSAPASAAAGTRVLARSTPSKRSVYSRTAAAPRWRTSSQIGRTFSIAASTSSPARGSTGASFSLLSWAADDPRRSILESTRPVYGAGQGSRRACPHRGHPASMPPGAWPRPSFRGQGRSRGSHLPVAHPGGQFHPACHQPGSQRPERNRAPGAQRQGGMQLGPR